MTAYAFTFKINGRPFTVRPFVRFSENEETARAEFERMAVDEWPGKRVVILSIERTEVNR